MSRLVVKDSNALEQFVSDKSVSHRLLFLDHVCAYLPSLL